MEDFLEKIGKKLGDTMEDFGKMAGELGRKAEDTLDIQKIKGQISAMKRSNERDFADIGKMIYEQYQNGGIVDAQFLAYCEEIQEREDEIKEREREIARIKGE